MQDMGARREAGGVRPDPQDLWEIWQALAQSGLSAPPGVEWLLERLEERGRS